MLKNKNLLVLLICGVLVWSGLACRTASETVDGRVPNDEAITVSAAISLRDAFEEIRRLYEQRTGRRVQFNFGASGALQRQIETGAPVDVFASAGARQMDQLADANLIDASTRGDFARNTLVLITPKDVTLNINSFEALNHPSMQRLAVGNPKTVPAGQYTEQLLTNTGLLPKLKSKLVFGEDVRQVLDYVVRGEVDAGIVYASDVVLGTNAVRVAATALENQHAPILYPIAILSSSRHKEAARAFIDLVLSSEGQQILRKYGFREANGR